MKIGYSVEGSTDRAILAGLKDRWCPQAELVEGHFRGQTGLSQKREIGKTCLELREKGASLLVFLRDSNNENWHAVVKDYEAACPADSEHMAVLAVCERNAECWLCADADWLAKELNVEPNQFRETDPKDAVAAVLEITRDDKQEPRIAALVASAPLERWTRNSRSFRDFYDKLVQKTGVFGCSTSL